MTLATIITRTRAQREKFAALPEEAVSKIFFDIRDNYTLTHQAEGLARYDQRIKELEAMEPPR